MANAVSPRVAASLPRGRLPRRAQAFQFDVVRSFLFACTSLAFGVKFVKTPETKVHEFSPVHPVVSGLQGPDL